MAGLLAEQVNGVVARQREIGISIPNDGEFGHSMSTATNYGAWWTYIIDRVSGLELRDINLMDQPDVRSEPGKVRLTGFPHRRDWKRFPDVYAHDASVTVGEQRAFPAVVGPIGYVGQRFVRADTGNLNAALERHGYGAGNGFINALAPASAIRLTDLHHKSDEEALHAWAEVLREEYKAVIDAGLGLQFDDPAFAENWDQINPEPSVADYLKFTERGVEALNWAIRDLPADKLRFHLCHGSWHGPHTTDLDLKYLVELMFTINVRYYSFEAANLVEHPELVADRITRFAKRVGADRVVASTDCGLGGRVHPDIAWAKLEALVQGAELAGKRL